jgi:hypothetical protein
VLILFCAVALGRAAEPPGAIAPEVKIARADLDRFQGTYRNEEIGMEIKVDLPENHLRFTVIKGNPPFQFLLIPTSPTHFRAEGKDLAPGLAMDFQVEGEKTTALVVNQPGMPLLTLQRIE